MTRELRVLAAAGALLLALSAADAAFAQKSGGILRMGHFDSPASMSMLEELTQAVNRPMSGVFNNLVMFDQHVPQNSLRSIVPDLATGWAWNEEGTELTFPLRHGVKWHDGKPFTAADVKCTVDLLMGNAKEKLRINPRKSWFANVAEVTTNGDYEATFHLKRPQPSFLALLATGWSPIYPCHVSPRDMRSHPIGTGPFKFVEFQPNERITVTRNPDYWKPGRPYLDGIEYTIIKDVSTRLLSFISGKDDVYFGVTIPQLKDVKNEAPEAICEMFTANVARNLIVNRDVPPFDNPDLRRAMSLSLDRKAFVDILTEGQGDIGGVMQPPPSGLWGMPPDLLKTLPGYDPDVREEPRRGAQPDGEARLRARQASRGDGLDAQPGALPRSGGDPDRPAEANLYGRGARPARHDAMVSEADAQGLHSRPQHHRDRCRRSRPGLLRKLCLRRACATTPATATPRSTRWSTPSRRNRMSRSASRWCGRSKRNWPTTTRGRSCSTIASRTATTPRSRA